MEALQRSASPLGVEAGVAALIDRLSMLVASLMALASAVGLAWPALYQRDADWIRAAWFGNDLVTLVVAVPLLIAGVVYARRGSLRADLLRYAVLAYAVYNYAFYVFGAAMNELFHVFVALFVLPAVTLGIGLARLRPSVVTSAVTDRLPRRFVAAYMGFTALGLAIAWTVQWAGWLFAQIEPDVGEQAFTLIAAMDLSFMVPYYGLGAVLLWRRHVWGYILAAVMIVKGATYTLVLTVTSAVAAVRGIEGTLEQIPVWGIWTLVGAVATVLLYRGFRTGDAG
jgi:hypothetical protein